MSRSTATITAEQRKAIYELVCLHLVGLNDLCLALDRKDFVTAERLGLEFGEDLRLMEDLGWEEEDGRQTVALAMPAGNLTETLKRLRAKAESLFAESPDEHRVTEEEEARPSTRRTSPASTSVASTFAEPICAVRFICRR
jgi:hypothetical protein